MFLDVLPYEPIKYAMNHQDPLSELFRNWKPQSPYHGDQFVQDTIRQIRKVQQESIWQRGYIACTEFLEIWLPSPEIGMPIAVSLILLMIFFHWPHAVQQGKALAALQWHEQFSNPLTEESLAGTYTQLTRKD